MSLTDPTWSQIVELQIKCDKLESELQHSKESLEKHKSALLSITNLNLKLAGQIAEGRCEIERLYAQVEQYERYIRELSKVDESRRE